MANYSLVSGTDPLRGFVYRYTKPLWLHGNIPRVPEDEAYVVSLNFKGNVSLSEFLAYYAPQNGDTLEVFNLDKRVLVIGVQVTVEGPADVVLQPVTNSGAPFDQINCAHRTTATYLVNHGVMDKTTVVSQHSLLLEEPDYFGFQIVSGAENLQYLNIRVQLIVRDEYDWFARSNSSKHGNQQWIL